MLSKPLEIGKIYEVREPKKANNLGFAPTVKIVREQDGLFFDDSDDCYTPDGISHLNLQPYKDLVKELPEKYFLF